LLQAVTELGYANPTPIQERAIPLVLEGRDLMAAAQTGTGKTAAFALPILERLMRSPSSRRSPRVLVLVPTRELATQVGDSLLTLAEHLPLRAAVIFGGVSPRPQIDALSRGVDIIVATPGRLLDHLQTRVVDLSHIDTLVLDEADRMLDMGFIRPIRRLIAALPAKRQTLMFSATFSNEIRDLAKSLLRDPVSIDISPRNS
jgi:ATP-dependent RNA helicase RhlE